MKAWTTGQLYDTGPYPALFAGEDAIAGELWTFDEAALPRVLKVLDAVEEYEPDHPELSLYHRLCVKCFDQQGGEHAAYTYRYARPDERRYFRRLEPAYSWGDRRLAIWPPGGDW